MTFLRFYHFEYCNILKNTLLSQFITKAKVVILMMYYGRSEKTAGNPEKFKALVNSKNPNINVVIPDS